MPKFDFRLSHFDFSTLPSDSREALSEPIFNRDRAASAVAAVYTNNTGLAWQREEVELPPWPGFFVGRYFALDEWGAIAHILPGGRFITAAGVTTMPCIKKPRRPKLRALLRERQGGLCCYCLRPMIVSEKVTRMEPNAETFEHLQRLRDGGKDAPDNIALACSECNHGRGDIDWLTYASYKRGELYG